MVCRYTHVIYRETHDKLVGAHTMLVTAHLETKRSHIDDHVPDIAPYYPHETRGLVPVPEQPRSKYPGIKYWTKEEWDKYEKEKRNSTNPTEKPAQRGGTRCANNENVTMTFLEEADGTAIGGLLAGEIRRTARTVWRGLYKRDLAPKKWSNALSAALDEYTREMETRWPILRYCSNHWKALHIATKNYSQWYKTYHNKMGVAHNTETTEPAHKKRRTATEDDDTSEHEAHPETDAASEVSDNDDDIPTPSMRDDNVRESFASSSRPKARPAYKDPLYVSKFPVDFTNDPPPSANALKECNPTLRFHYHVPGPVPTGRPVDGNNPRESDNDTLGCEEAPLHTTASGPMIQTYESINFLSWAISPVVPSAIAITPLQGPGVPVSGPSLQGPGVPVSGPSLQGPGVPVPPPSSHVVTTPSNSDQPDAAAQSSQAAKVKALRKRRYTYTTKKTPGFGFFAA